MVGWTVVCAAARELRFPSAFLLIALILGGCAAEEISRVSPGSELHAYPHDSPLLGAVDLQVFRQGSKIEIVNHTAGTIADREVWLNERFRGRLVSLAPGESVRMSLFDFKDEYGQAFRAGGLFAKYRSEPLVKAEIAAADGAGLQGMIVIPEPEF